jgi:hypothetical protein
MLTKKELKEYCENARENYLPHISIDCVVFKMKAAGTCRAVFCLNLNLLKWPLTGS